MQLITNRARAWVYAGEWVADCPREGCNNTEYLYEQTLPGGARTVRKGSFLCTSCRMLADIEWPPESVMDGIMAVLVKRPIPHTRNWYPQDHPVAVCARIPHGQSIDDLRAENVEHGVLA